MLFFTKWVAVRAIGAKLWENGDTSKSVVFIGVPTSGAFKNEWKRGYKISTTHIYNLYTFYMPYIPYVLLK